MHPKSLRSVPALIAAVVILIACVIEVFHPHNEDRIECMTYDWRVRFAQEHRPASFQVATNLGFVAISDDTIAKISDGTLGFQYGLYWPRHLYGRVVKELSDQGAKAIAFDILFANLRSDHAPVTLANGSAISSDEYFARALRKSGRTVLAATHQLMPEPLFYTNALDVGNISVERDSNGTLRRDTPFVDVHIWHPLILKKAKLANFDLERTIAKSNELVFFCERDKSRPSIPLDANGEIKTADLKLESLPQDAPASFVPFQMHRTWSLGIVLAAYELGLDLDHPVIEKNRITLNGPNGLTRVIPLDPSGMFHIEWSIRPNDPKLKVGVLEDVLVDSINRANGQDASQEWKDKIVVIGSIATGNDLTDLGSTPLDKETYLVSKHWNVANSIITGQFVSHCPLWATLSLIISIGAFSAFVTWKSRPVTGSIIVILLIVGYIFLSYWLFAQFRFWLPVLWPCFLAAFMTHAMTATYRVRVESQERNRVKNIFSKLVAPVVVNELLTAPDLNKLRGERRELTVLFADVRGFTELTDSTQTRAEEHVRTNKLNAAEAEAYFNETAKGILDNVSECLTTISECITRHHGCFDKYIGDCVMAFWGAPTNDPQHALHCVRAAIDAQRGLHALNQQRCLKNEAITKENEERAQAGLSPKPLLPLISLGTGINSGMAIVGLMGSETYGSNYTVFGREINLAARLEGVSGHGRIVIGEATYLGLKRDDPALADQCIELAPVKVKGFKHEVKAYEVPWRESVQKLAESTGTTQIVKPVLRPEKATA